MPATFRQRFTYKKRDFWSPRLQPPAEPCYAAVCTFLRHQPEIQNEQISLADFEFLWYAAELSFRTTPALDDLLNIPSQTVRYPPNNRWRWHRTNIRRAQYFLEVFVFLRRKALLSTISDLDAARSLLQQPCNIQTRTLSYANTLWYCFVPDSRMTFFDELITVLTRTTCYQQEVWSQRAWHELWETIQTATDTQDTTVQLTRRYQGERWRRQIASHTIVVAAELQHYLESQPVMSLDAFLRCFDTCILYPASQWDYWCTSAVDRLATLSSAASATAFEPKFYVSDFLSSSADTHPPENLRAHNLSAAAHNWPNAMSTDDLLQHLQAYRAHFEDLLTPPDVCAFCACPSWRSRPEMLNLRELPFGLHTLHTLLSGQNFLQQYALKDFPHPATFVGLTFEHLEPHFVPLPEELQSMSPVACLINSRHCGCSFFLYSSCLSHMLHLSLHISSP